MLKVVPVMSKFFYAKLAAINIRKNARIYLPYLLTCIFTVAAYYMMGALSVNPGIDDLEIGSGSLRVTLGLGVWVVSLFACIFIFYTNSFLMKRRKKEIGLYNVLGMGKGHLSRMIFYETVYLAVISLVVGLGLGILLDKAAFLTLANLMQAEVPLGFYVSIGAMRSAVILFGVLFLLIFLNSLRQIHLTNPIELLRGGQLGEKEPKARWLLALIGAAMLGGGYWIAVTITNPVQALTLFFVAVILVILGTYCLFTAGSIAILKLLRKNRSFYYKANHFIAISGMIYRMKQNAVGLANICVLSTMVLVMVSSTFSMYIGMEDMMEKTYPRDMEFLFQGDSEDVTEIFEGKLEEILEQENAEIENVLSYTYLNTSAQKVNDRYIIDPSKQDNGMAVAEYCTITVVTLEEYNRIMGTQKSLEEGEILLYYPEEKNLDSVFPLGEEDWKVREQITEFPDNMQANVMMTTHIGVVVKDKETLLHIDQMRKWPGTEDETTTELESCYSFDLKDHDPQLEERISDKTTDFFSSLYQEVAENGGRLDMIRYYQKSQEEALVMGLVGGLLFVGVFLGALFIMATILIIYYKQISEGYDDKDRFTIMEKVGMDKREIRRTIRSQVLTVFFLPLIMAGIHTAFAFPMISRILQILALQNVGLYILCTVISYLAFVVLYSVIYMLTARTYYKIVS